MFQIGKEMDKELEPDKLKQVVCKACGSLSHLLIGFLKYKTKIEILLSCTNCSRTSLFEITELGKIRSRSKDTSYFG